MFLPLIHPSTVLVSGPTGCGKTVFVSRLIKDGMFSKCPERVIWFYNEWQKLYDELDSKVEFRKDCDESFYDTLSPLTTNLVVLDDQMSTIGDSKVLLKLFTEGSHHRNLSVIYIVQNLFDKGRSHRTVSLNAQYIILFKNPRDKSQIDCLSRQMYGRRSSFLVDCYHDATRDSYGYLLLDLRPDSDDELRIRSRIFKDEVCEIYKSTHCSI
jgi:GTPase SAR1 family protein